MKTTLLIATIALGILFPVLHSYSFIIKYLLMLMLFFSFLQMDIKGSDLTKSHFYILFLNIFIPIIGYFLVNPFNSLLAQSIFITAIAPTAIASPAIVGLLKGKIEFTVFSILLTNFTIAFILPFLLPSLLSEVIDLSFYDLLIEVATIFIIPFVLSLIIKRYIVERKFLYSKLNSIVFYILILNINLGTSKASHFIREEMSFSDIIIYKIAIASIILCFLSFYLGKLVAPKNLKLEGGQSLGQKNNGFTLWIALTYISPLAVLGPVFYILTQNIYISWQLRNKKSTQFVNNSG